MNENEPAEPIGRVPFNTPDGSYDVRLRCVPGLTVVELPPGIGLEYFKTVEQMVEIGAPA